MDFSLLPPEIKIKIFSHCNGEDLIPASFVCKEWGQLCNDHLLWKHIFKKEDPVQTSLKEMRRQSISRISWSRRYPKVYKAAHPINNIDIACMESNQEKLFVGTQKGVNIFNRIHGQQELLHCSTVKEDSVASLNCNERYLSINLRSKLVIYKIHSGKKPMYSCDYHPLHPIQCHDILEDKALIGIGSLNGSSFKAILLCNLEKGTYLKEFDVKSSDSDVVTALKTHGDDLLAGSINQEIKVWDLRTYQCSHQLKSHTESILSVHWFDGMHFASTSMDKTVKIWDRRNLQNPYVSKKVGMQIIDTASTSSDLAIAGYNQIKIMDKDGREANVEKLRKAFHPKTAITSISIPDGDSRIYVGSEHGPIDCLDYSLETFEPEQ